MFYLLALLAFPVFAPELAAQPSGFAAPPALGGKVWNNAKAENGAVIFWRLNSIPGQPQVYVFSNTGHQQLAMEVLPQLSGSVSVSIPDVSRGKSGRLAVSSVTVSGDGRVVALLLIYSPEGRLLQAQALDPSREISLLEVDDDDSIWTLCDNDKGDYIAHYSPLGADLGGSVSRAALPELPDGIEGDMRGGTASFGVARSNVWFSAPTARTIVSVDKEGGVVSAAVIPALERPPDVFPGSTPQLLRSVALADGRLAVQVLWSGDKRALALYLRDSVTGKWNVDPRGSSGRLIGAEGSTLAFVEYDQSNRSVSWR